MATSDNIFTQVITYQKSELAYLQNICPFLANANTKFDGFEDIKGQLGATVSFDLPPRFTTTNSLVINFQAAEQRVHNLTVDFPISSAYSASNSQVIFNLDPMDYMEEFGKSQVEEIGAQLESRVADQCEKATYRFYGDAVTQINSFGQLAKALAFFRNYGAANHDTKGFLSDIVVPDIVNSGLNQFAPNRNNELANSWELGDFSKCEWFSSNLLPVHKSGTEGNEGSTLTVVSVTQDASGAITAIEFSGTNAANDPNSIKAYDKFQFQDNVAGQPNLRYLTFIGHKVSSNPVQFRATSDATSTGASHVNVSIYPPLQSAAGKNQNLNNAIVAGMQVKVLPNYRAGLIMSGQPLFVAMPRMPDQVPFPTANAHDPQTGISVRSYYGTLFGQDQQGFVHDALLGRSLVDEYAMAVIFPE